MKIENFLIDFAEALEIDAASININTEYKELDVWDSMAALNLIAMVDDKYQTSIGGDSIEQAKTISDLWMLIQQ